MTNIKDCSIIRQGIINIPKLSSSGECYLNRNMVYDMHDGDYTVTVGTSSVDTIDTAEIKVRDKQIFITD